MKVVYSVLFQFVVVFVIFCFGMTVETTVIRDFLQTHQNFSAILIVGTFFGEVLALIVIFGAFAQSNRGLPQKIDDLDGKKVYKLLGFSPFEKEAVVAFLVAEREDHYILVELTTFQFYDVMYRTPTALNQKTYLRVVAMVREDEPDQTALVMVPCDKDGSNPMQPVKRPLVSQQTTPPAALMTTT